MLVSIWINTTLEYEFVIITSLLFGHTHAKQTGRDEPTSRTTASGWNCRKNLPTAKWAQFTCSSLLFFNARTHMQTYTHKWKHTSTQMHWLAHRLGCNLAASLSNGLQATQSTRCHNSHILTLAQMTVRARHTRSLPAPQMFHKCQSARNKDTFYGVCSRQDSHVDSWTQIFERGKFL